VHTAAALIKNAKSIPIRTNKFPRTIYTPKITPIGLRSSAKRKKPPQRTSQNPQHTHATFESSDSQNSHSRQRTKSFHQNRCSKPLHHYCTQHRTLRQQGSRPSMSFSKQWEKKYTTILAFLEKTKQQVSQSRNNIGGCWRTQQLGVPAAFLYRE
jgi:hypothetical protein